MQITRHSARDHETPSYLFQIGALTRPKVPDEGFLGACFTEETRRNVDSGLNVVPALDPELLKHGMKSRTLQAEAFGCAASATDHPLAFAQGAKNVIAFRGFEVRVRRTSEFLGAWNSPSGERSVGPEERMTERSMKFSSSRIFPGQRHCTRVCMVSGGIVSIRSFACRAPRVLFPAKDNAAEGKTEYPHILTHSVS
jgi:hypothetical protein